LIFIPKLELKVDIKAPAKRIYAILDDDSIETKWNLSANENEEIGPDKYSIKTTIGDVISTVSERVESEKLSYSIEGGFFSSMGYILNQKGSITEVLGWAEFDDEKDRKMLKKAGDILLKSLKSFVEYLEEGGDIDKYNKKQIMVAP